MNGKGELAASSYKKNQRNAHVTILARNLVRHTENGLISYTMSDLDKMSLIDLEVIRLIIKHVEPQIDTELIVPHPDADNLPKAEKNIIVDITGQISFFFPSGTI